MQLRVDVFLCSNQSSTATSWYDPYFSIHNLQQTFGNGLKNGGGAWADFRGTWNRSSKANTYR